MRLYKFTSKVSNDHSPILVPASNLFTAIFVLEQRYPSLRSGDYDQVVVPPEDYGLILRHYHRYLCISSDKIIKILHPKLF